MSAPVETDAPAGSTANEQPWLRLDTRVIWVDLVRTILSLVPTVVAITVFGVEPEFPDLWPVLVVAVIGVTGAVADLLRWLKTRYRITEERVEVRTGFLVRKQLWIGRDRIRTVDASAKLLQRLAGLRVVTVAAGLSGPVGATAALKIDAVSVPTAADLRRLLLGDATAPAPALAKTATTGPTAAAEPAEATETTAATTTPDVELARFQWSWIAYNIISIWALLTGAGIIWGTYWAIRFFGVDPWPLLRDLVGWDSRSPLWLVGVSIGVLLVVGCAGMAWAFVTSHWNFRLVRAAGPGGTVLRTTQGLFRTREVDRDDERLRGVEIREPFFWRWMGVADTAVISTGLSVWSATGGQTILPRGPVRTAKRVAASVLGDDPLDQRLTRHPPAALRRRLVRAVLVAAALTAALAWLGGPAGALPGWVWWIGAASLVPGLALAVLSYRSLGHAVVGDYLVVRSGSVVRATAALQGRAVIGWVVRQSVFQRRLGLATLVATTAAGNGQYAASDIDAATAVAIAERVAPGLLTDFRAKREATAQRPIAAASRPMPSAIAGGSSDA